MVFVQTDQVLKRLIDEEYTRHPFYRSRKRGVYLGRCGHRVKRKRVQRLMRCMSLARWHQGRTRARRTHCTTLHKVYSCWLRGVPVVRAHPVCSTDFPCVRLARGFADRVAVMDGYCRRVLSWPMSNRMGAAFCVDGLEEALREHGKPEVFNSDPGSPLTSEAFTGVLNHQEIALSMDGRGRAYDNIFVQRLWRSVKHEDLYLNGYTTMGQWMVGPRKYFAFYPCTTPSARTSHWTIKHRQRFMRR